GGAGGARPDRRGVRESCPRPAPPPGAAARRAAARPAGPSARSLRRSPWPRRACASPPRRVPCAGKEGRPRKKRSKVYATWGCRARPPQARGAAPATPLRVHDCSRSCAAWCPAIWAQGALTRAPGRSLCRLRAPGRPWVAVQQEGALLAVASGQRCAAGGALRGPWGSPTPGSRPHHQHTVEHHMSDENRKAASLTFAFPGGELSITLNDQDGQRLLKRVLPIVQAYTPNLYAILLT